MLNNMTNFNNDARNNSRNNTRDSFRRDKPRDSFRRDNTKDSFKRDYSKQNNVTPIYIPSTINIIIKTIILHNDYKDKNYTDIYNKLIRKKEYSKLELLISANSIIKENNLVNENIEEVLKTKLIRLVELVNSSITNFITINNNKNITNTNNTFITNTNILINTGYLKYLPENTFKNIFKEIEKELHPLHIKQNKIIEEIHIKEVTQKMEIKETALLKKKLKQTATNTPGTIEWYDIHFKNKLWPGHPKSDKLNLQWGKVTISSGLYIKGIINGIEVKDISAFKQSCGKKSRHGKSKNIKRPPCTGMGFLLKDLRDDLLKKFQKDNKDKDKEKKDKKKKKEAEKKAEEYYLPAAFINVSVDPDKYSKWKLFHIVPMEDFPLCRKFNVLINEMNNLTNINTFDIDIVFENDDTDIDNIYGDDILLDDIEVEEDDVDFIDENNYILKQSLLIKAKKEKIDTKNLDRKLEKKRERNRSRVANMSNNIIDDLDMIIAYNSKGEEIGYYDYNGNIVDENNNKIVIIDDLSNERIDSRGNTIHEHNHSDSDHVSDDSDDSDHDSDDSDSDHDSDSDSDSDYSGDTDDDDNSINSNSTNLLYSSNNFLVKKNTKKNKKNFKSDKTTRRNNL